MSWLIVIAIAVTLQLGQTAPRPVQGGSIEGRVVAAADGQPIAGATVRAVVLPIGLPAGTPAPAPIEVKTGANGEFVIANLAAGRFSLTGSAEGFVTEIYRPTSPSQAPQIRDGQRLTDVTIRLSRAATISGVVRDERGAPMFGISVNVYRRVILTTRRVWSAGRVTVITNRDGRFTIDNVPPGEYVVSVAMRVATVPRPLIDDVLAMPEADRAASLILASLNASRGPVLGTGFTSGSSDVVVITNGASHQMSPPAPAPDGFTRTYRTTYFPSVTTLDEAGVIALKAAERRDDIDITVVPVPGVRVSGVLTRDAKPAAYVGVRLIASHAAERDIDYEGEVALTATDATGAFTFQRVPPGDYTLKVAIIEIIPGRGQAVMPASSLLRGWAAKTISVGAANLAIDPIAISPPLAVSGRLVFAGAGAMSPTSQSRTTVWMASLDGGMISPPATVEVGVDGRFTLTGAMAGRYHLWGGSVAGWTVTTVVAAGRDITAAPIELVDRDVTDVAITLTPAPVTISGRVLNDAREPVVNAHVVMFPADYSTWIANGMSIRVMKSLRSSATGTFGVAGLPPGPYIIGAFADGDTEGWPDRRVVEAAAKVGQVVILEPAHSLAVELPLKRLVR